MTEGRCLCGVVRWQVTPRFVRMSHCHCQMCRKAHGAPFATFGTVEAEDFRFLAGEEALTVYESSPGFQRPFCRHCGASAPHPSLDGRMSVPMGSIDGEVEMRPQAHIFASSRAPWVTLDDGLPRFDGYRHDMISPAAPRPELGPAAEGIVRGSCLCGDVAYEVELPFQAIHNCHCSRCRQARAAAHTCNGFVPAGALRFVRGEGGLAIYKLPEARVFSQVFCTRCGSGMPRRDLDRDIAVVPMGTLDDDPGVGPEDHIYVGSMAGWYSIADDLPQYDTRPG